MYVFQFYFSSFNVITSTISKDVSKSLIVLLKKIQNVTVNVTMDIPTTYKGSFGFHHLGLKSKNLFVIRRIYLFGCRSFENFRIFHPMPKLNSFWCPLISVVWPNKMISLMNFVTFLPKEMK
jgi:hypothetical protein